MSGLLADAGTIEVTELEEILGKDMPCENEGCDQAAKWRVTAIPCGHSIHQCTYHKLKEVKGFEFDFPHTYCHLDPDLHVSELKVEEL